MLQAVEPTCQVVDLLPITTRIFLEMEDRSKLLMPAGTVATAIDELIQKSLTAAREMRRVELEQNRLRDERMWRDLNRQSIP